ncbi:MAG: hypothetical protein M0Z33_10495 [Actinomycetota bacterium]|nr:hypothetical protein [Actinomycetota bacterium]
MARIGRVVGACACVSVSVLALGASAASAGSVRGRDRSPRAVSGNPAVIAFYRKVVAATRAATAVAEYFTATDSIAEVRVNPNRSYTWYQLGPPNPGFTPARGVLWIVAAAGRVRFVTESFVYGGVGKSFGPFGIALSSRGEVMLGGNAFPRVVSPSAASPSGSLHVYQPCAGVTSGAVDVGGYVKVGGPAGYGLYGDFLSMHRAGGSEIVTSRYPWGRRGQKVTEVDTVPLATDLPVRSVQHVSAVPGIPAYTFAYSSVWYHSPVQPPTSDGICATYLASAS